MLVHNQKNKSLKSTLFVDYRPAELKIGTQWLVVYYIKNPNTQLLERQRIVVPAHSSKSERIKHGKKIVFDINSKLEKGSLTFYSEILSVDYKTFEYCKNQFMHQLQVDISKGYKRADTERTYKSYFSMIDHYTEKNQLKINYMFEISRSFVNNYLDFILYDRNNSPRTYNNHLGFFIGFFNFCLERGFTKENCAFTIVKKKQGEKIRQIFTDAVKNKVKTIHETDFNYYTLCMATYFCFLRRTELTKLKVENINLKEYSITIPASVSKNHKEETITIPNKFYPLIERHIKNGNANDFIYSANGFKPGPKQLNPKKISDTWEKNRKTLNIEKIYQFYSLKDSGITDLLNSGVPSLKVRNQARHGELSTTEKYTVRSKKSDEIVQNANFDF